MQDYSKIEAEKLSLESRDFSLLDCIENAVQLCYDMAGKKGLDMTYQVDPRCPNIVVGDVTRLQQIILNLLSNACKFTSHVCVHHKAGAVVESVEALDPNDHSKCKHGEVVLTVTARVIGPVLPPANSSFYQSFLAASPSERLASPSPLTRGRRLTGPRGASSSNSPTQNSAALTVMSPSSRSRHILDSETKRQSIHLPLIASTISSGRPVSPVSSPPVHTATPPLPTATPPPTATRYRLLFAVRDSGIGIREDVQKKLFNSFTQAETSTTRRFGGTGLGLAISKRLAEAMGGEMWLTSTEGKGSTFYFSITTSSPEQPAAVTDVVVQDNSLPVMHRAPFLSGFSMLPSSAESSATTAVSSVTHSRIGSAGQSVSATPVAERRLLTLSEPLATSYASLHDLSASEVVLLRGKHVLIICDRQGSTAMFTLLALSYGMRVVTAASVSQAEAVMRNIAQGKPVDVAPTARIASPPPLPEEPLADIPREKAEEVHVSTVSAGEKHKQDVSMFLASLSLGGQQPASTLSAPSSHATSTMASSAASSNVGSASVSDSFSATARGGRDRAKTVVSEPLTAPAVLTHFDLVLYDCDTNESEDSMQLVEAALLAIDYPAVLCVMSTRRREDRRDRAPAAASHSSPNMPHSPNQDDSSFSPLATPSLNLSVPLPHSLPPRHPLMSPSSEIPTIQAHNLNLTDQLKADERNGFSTSADIHRSVTPLPPSPFERNGYVELLIVMKPLKQRDLLNAICSALATIDDIKLQRTEAHKVAEETAASKASNAAGSVSLPQPQSLSNDAFGSPTDTLADLPATSPHIVAPQPGRASTQPVAANPPSTSSNSSTSSHLPRQSHIRKVSSNPSSHIRNMAIEAPLHILLAEDNKINQKMMTMLLAKLGYKIAIAENGREVIEHVQRGVDATATATGAAATAGQECEYDVILMDVSMEEMDGLECTSYLRLNYDRMWPAGRGANGGSAGGRRPYIIACTANASSEFQKKCTEVGMDGWVSKPVEIQQLVKALTSAHAVLHGKGKAAGTSVGVTVKESPSAQGK